MLKAFKNHINENLPFLKEGKLLIAISGGLDSVVLTHLSKQAKLHFSLAHCNFNLRNEASNADEDFVMHLAEDLDVEVFVQNFDTEAYAKTHKLSTQMAARELRYDWFEELSEQLKFDYILTAHHADDNLETFLINLTRGTGLEGLTGIPQVNKKLVRPLLSFSREALETYAKANNIAWREDATNASTKYLRNKLRHEVIPKLKEVNTELLSNFEKTINHLQDSKSLIVDAVSKVQNEVVSEEGDLIKFHIAKLQQLSNTKAYLYELLKDFGFTQWKDVYDLLEAQSGKQVFSKEFRLLKDREYLLLTRISSEENTNTIQVSENTKKTETTLGDLLFEEVETITETSPNCIFVDKDLLKYPLTIRHCKKGDYFYPFGMQGKKKLSKFFKDEKYSLLEKEKALVLCSEENIIWIINKRGDNRYKVTDKTNSILKITFQK
ncbi:tRNA lysidine(34) synthetase TilS [Oceanihabitans sediminis]|uniref:tRNA lysidine(34) synthetase TilS n=1 Tax=Oceanihabitans sediminis TaxID=1812012 RepID=UPI00299D976A|nr:tRNA lysidine(34) synthetase TilS [Oceanihabitans sediminis]MDX1773371.1 tRNA lysidine(34) synthetase TilS [Oceanihabitans sediminis]